MRRLLAFSVAGAVAQMVDGSLGMGYGVTSTSLLVTAGTAAALASASVHIAEVGISLVSGIAHHRFGNVDWRAVRWMALPGAAGAFVGANLLGSIPEGIATPWVATVLALLGVYVLVRAVLSRGVADLVRSRRHRRRFFLGLGAGAGFLDAAGGGGWGPLGTSTLLAAGRMEPRRVVGTVSASEFLVSLGASLGFLIALPWHRIDPLLVAALLGAGTIAAPLAAWITTHLDRRTLGGAVGVFIVATNMRTLAGLAGVRPSILTVSSVVLGVAWCAFAVRMAIVARRRRVPATAVYATSERNAS